MRILGEVCYRRMLVLDGKISEHLDRFDPIEGIEFAPLERHEIDKYLSLRPDQTREEVEARLDAQHVCFAARHQGRLVQVCWLAPRGTAWIEYLEWEFPLAPGEAYAYDFYAEPSARGRHLFLIQISVMSKFFADPVQARKWFPNHAFAPDARYSFVGAFHLENRIWMLFSRAGMRPREIVGYIGIGRLRWRFRRRAPSEEKLRRKARKAALRQRRRRRAQRERGEYEERSAPRTGMTSST